MAMNESLESSLGDSKITDADVVLYDSDGNAIDSHLDADGGYHIGVAITQAVFADSNNSSTDNLDSENSYTFTGTATSTLGVVGLQWSLKTDQNATVYIEESPDGENWDISYPFDYIASKGGRGETVQATQAYWRIRVVLTVETDTNYFRLDGILCPVATPLPSSLSADGRLKSECHISSQDDRHVWVNPTSELAISPVYRLVGTTFIGDAIDANFWDGTTGLANDGTAAQTGGILTITTSATSEGSSKVTSVRKGRFVAGSALLLSGAVNWVTAGTTSNVRRVGAFTTTDGYFMQLNGTTFSVGTRISSSDTLVDSGSFSGVYGSTWTPTANTYYKFSIEWTPLAVFYYINDKLLHKTAGAGLSATPTLPICIENTNGAITTDVSFKCLGLYIARQGELTTNPTYYHLSGDADTHVLKLGAGVLHSILFNNVTGTRLTIYDGVSAAGKVVGIITTTSGSIGQWTFGVPFSDGLTLVTVGNGFDCTVVYE